LPFVSRPQVIFLTKDAGMKGVLIKPLEASEMTTQDRPIRSSARTSIVSFLPAGIAIVIAVATGVAWLGQPLRLVQLVTLIGVSRVAGVSWAQAVSRLKRDRT
jgi:hypothetical protein